MSELDADLLITRVNNERLILLLVLGNTLGDISSFFLIHTENS